MAKPRSKEAEQVIAQIRHIKEMVSEAHSKFVTAFKNSLYEEAEQLSEQLRIIKDTEETKLPELYRWLKKDIESRYDFSTIEGINEYLSESKGFTPEEKYASHFEDKYDLGFEDEPEDEDEDWEED